jgi:pimeloyl-ACP methyl ester carboxylesterase
MRKERVRWAIAIAAGSLLLVAGSVGWTAYRHYAWAGEPERVVFKSGGLSLNGLLVKPEGKAPHAAIVFLHGSGRADGVHDLPDHRIHANAFVRKGLAVLVYDKRGTGDSEGDFATASYNDFVQDAVAAVTFLRARGDINPSRIGLLGTSEGGWLAPEVATTAADVAFIINKCGSPLSWQETVLFEIENELTAARIDPDTIRQALELRTRTWKYYLAAAADSGQAGGAERDAINAELVALRKRQDSKSIGLPAALPDYDANAYTLLASKVSYDPTPFLKKVDLPMLWVFGQNDVNVPTAKSVATLERLKTQFRRDITTKVYPSVGHSLMDWKSLANGGYVDGYLEFISDWARDHITPNEQAAQPRN